MKKLLLIGCTLITGCATNECSWSRYIIASDLDTGKTLSQILEHNLTRQENCK